ncbi:MAG: peptidase penicillin amidase [Bacteroidota bacterium]|nr:peptidase penicillin amidase [Bacteroidota bacterium]
MFYSKFLPKAAVAVVFVFGLLCFSKINAQVNVSNVDIVRDKWGVPHIFGKTDAETSYGLAWATCEDDFKTVQRILLAVKGRLGEVDGKGGAILDFLSFISGADPVVDAAYDTVFTPQYKKVLDGYVEGLNAYAKANPNEVLRKGLFPITGKDVVKEFVLTQMLLTSTYLDVQKIFLGTIKNYEQNYPQGSNAFAFNRSRTTDGKTYLAVNSHQPLEGMFSWYEAHICSEEGLNIMGATFAGGVNIFVGTTPNLGWACTLNHPDMDDVYKLEMNPKSHLEYKFDGHWEKLAVRKKTIKVKLGPFRIPITKTFYWSKYGTTISNKEGFYSIRFPANMDIRSPEQLYRMNKAKSFAEWRNVMRMGAIPGMNFVYADRQDNIFYASPAELPYRDPAYNWLKVVPGNTSKTLWPPYFHPFDSTPQVLNPKCGYLVNTNNSAFDITGPGDNADPKKYDRTYGYGLEKNNRSIMAHWLIAQQPKLSYEDFKRIKFNRTFNDSIYDYGLDNALVLFNLSPVKYPDLADALEVIRSWNHQTDVNNKEAALVTFTLYHIIDKITARGTNYENNTFTEKEYAEALRAGKKHMLKYFGALRVPLGDVQKHARGTVEIPVGGMPEVRAATITQPYRNGMRRTFVGDSYIQLVRYSKDTLEIESINAFGASAKPYSPHYTDQMQLFAAQKLKPMTLDKATIYRDAESVYHPVRHSNKKDSGLLSSVDGK